LDWSTTLATVFPEYADIMRPEYKPVTLSDVLSHGAGFMANPSVQFSGSTLREQRTAAVAWTLQQPPAQQRGRYLYSNLGYIIAGAIAERLASQSFEELLMDRVLKPLGITRAGFGPMGTPGKEDQPLQHVLDNDGHHISISPDPSADNPPFYNSAGRLHMSIGDWAKFARWVLNNELGNVTLLKPETAARLTTGITQVGGTVYYA
jgi:CubicO group peptidase (beta-lactamase class C family)